MSKRKKPPSSSLELLLDTICNTLGGVLFLAILVSLMLRASSPLRVVAISAESLQEEILGLEKQQADTTTRLESLRQAAAGQERIAEQFATPDMAKALTAYRELREERDGLISNRASRLAQIARSQGEILHLMERQKSLDEAMVAAGTRVREAEVAIRSELGTRAQTARLPRLRMTNKREIGLIVRYGRVYFWHRYDRFGNRLGLNTDEFVIVEDHGPDLETIPKPYAGLPIGDLHARTALAVQLREFDNRRHYLALVVWEDSFDVFQLLKKVVVDLGFEYRLMPVAAGECILDRGGSERRVQ
jgi:hypothetical protein